MSACPICNMPGEHVEVRIRRDSRVFVMHKCPPSSKHSAGEQWMWQEEARDPEAVLALFGWPRRPEGVEIESSANVPPKEQHRGQARVTKASSYACPYCDTPHDTHENAWACCNQEKEE